MTTTTLGYELPTPKDPTTNNNYATRINNAIEGVSLGVTRAQISMPLMYPEARTYQIVTKSRKPATIKSLTIKTDAGTLTAALKINGTAITGLSAVSVTSTESTATATAANTLAEGDDIRLTLSSISGVTELDFNIWLDVTGIGTV